MPDRKGIVTIDGPSGAGKSTISRQLAAKLRYTYLDTGAMYRAVGLKIERANVALEETAQLTELLAATELRLETRQNGDLRVFLDGEDVSRPIRTAAMGLVASRVSAHPLVRRKLTELQRRLGGQGAVVAEGRDMGTVVFPEAPYKFYLDASPEVRAGRRYQQLLAQGQEADLQEIRTQIIQRDRDDSARALAPLKPAADALIIDSSQLGTEEVIAAMLAKIYGNRKAS